MREGCYSRQKKGQYQSHELDDRTLGRGLVKVETSVREMAGEDHSVWGVRTPCQNALGA